MMTKPKKLDRRRMKGRRERAPFVGFPKHMVESPEFARLSRNGRSLLFDLAVQYNGYNNGDLSFTWKMAKKRGWKSKGTLQKAKRELEESVFVLTARQGGKNLCSLYALSFHEIDECNGKHYLKTSIVPPHSWRKRKKLAR